MGIEIRQLSMNYGKFAALQDINLQIPTGQMVALLGPSGSGKTSLLRAIAGLEVADQGQILFDGTDMTGKSVGERHVGFVFQHYALFRHLSVFDNVAFGLHVLPRKKRPGKKEIQERVQHLLELVQLGDLHHRYPHQLSGGQRQRVALARALAIEPKVLLLDEPFGALDAKVRLELRRWLRQLHESLHITSIFVTHDQEEALEMADQVAVMDQGRIQQVGSPLEIYEHPANPFVYSFIGRVNQFHNHTDGTTAISFVRPHEVGLSKVRNDQHQIPARVKHIHAVGPIIRVELHRLDGDEYFEVELGAERFAELQLQVGETLFAHFEKARVFAKDTHADGFAVVSSPVINVRSLPLDA